MCSCPAQRSLPPRTRSTQARRPPASATAERGLVLLAEAFPFSTCLFGWKTTAPRKAVPSSPLSEFSGVQDYGGKPGFPQRGRPACCAGGREGASSPTVRALHLGNGPTPSLLGWQTEVQICVLACSSGCQRVLLLSAAIDWSGSPLYSDCNSSLTDQ